MKNIILMTAAIAAAVVVHGAAPQTGQGQNPSQFPLSLGLREKGSSLTGAFEGWYHDKDGTTRVLVGYMNRNTKQEFDIPAGPNNRIEPGGPDQGQPTHFQSGRQWGVFTIKLPKDFGDKRLTWTLVANGFTNTITLHTHADYIIEPFEDAASKNTPPVIRFDPNGKTFTGPPSAIAATLSTSVGRALALDAWVSDEGPKLNPIPAGLGFTPPPSSVKWSLFRGPAAGSTPPGSVVTIDPANPKIDKDSGKVTANATFAAPGEYILRMQANDSTGEGGGGFQCCWTNVHVKVIVAPRSTAGL